MTPEELQDLSTLPQFPKTAGELIHIAGIDATAALITAWPGQEFPVPVHGRRANKLGARRFEQLAEIVGEEAAQRIVDHWGGLKLTIPNCKAAVWVRQQSDIRAMYDRLTGQKGYSHPEAIFEIGIAHRVSGRCVELVLKRCA